MERLFSFRNTSIISLFSSFYLPPTGTIDPAVGLFIRLNVVIFSASVKNVVFAQCVLWLFGVFENDPSDSGRLIADTIITAH